MTRIVKHPEERRKEIVETAQELFIVQGYAETSVEAIIRRMNVAKGTFYHYFKSKEEVLAAVVDNLLEGILEQARLVAANPSFNAVTKLQLLLGGRNQPLDEARKMAESLHRPENRELHEKTNVETLRRLSPIVAGIVEQGVAEGVFRLTDVLETVQFLLAGAQVLSEKEMFGWTDEELRVRSRVTVNVIERALGAEPGTFGNLTENDPEDFIHG